WVSLLPLLFCFLVLMQHCHSFLSRLGNMCCRNGLEFFGSVCVCACACEYLSLSVCVCVCGGGYHVCVYQLHETIFHSLSLLGISISRIIRCPSQTVSTPATALTISKSENTLSPWSLTHL